MIDSQSLICLFYYSLEVYVVWGMYIVQINMPQERDI